MKLTPHSTRIAFWRSLALALVASLFAGRIAAQTEADDAKLIAEMRQRMVAVQKQILASQDPAEQVQLQKNLTAIIEETMPKLTAKARVPMMVGLKLIQPMQEAGSTYMQMIADYSASPQSDFSTIKSKEDIQGRRETIARLNEANGKLIERLNNFETDANTLLDQQKMSAADKRDFLAGLSQSFGRRIGPTKAIRNLDTALFAKLGEALNLLDENWGKWEANEGTIAWKDEAADAKYQAISAEIGQLAERQTKAQEVLSQRL